MEQQERREGYIQVPQQFIERLTRHVDQEEGMFRGLKLFSIVFGVLFSTLMGLATWVFVEKNADFRKVQETIQEHTAQNSRTLAVLETILAEHKRQQEQLDKNTENVYRMMGGKR